MLECPWCSHCFFPFRSEPAPLVISFSPKGLHTIYMQKILRWISSALLLSSCLLGISWGLIDVWYIPGPKLHLWSSIPNLIHSWSPISVNPTLFPVPWTKKPLISFFHIPPPICSTFFSSVFRLYPESDHFSWFVTYYPYPLHHYVLSLLIIAVAWHFSAPTFSSIVYSPCGSYSDLLI